MGNDEELFFAEVKEPVNVKRNVLEAQKEVVEGLQRYENIKVLREKKLESINKLRGTIKELLKLIFDLKAALPQTKIREAAKFKKRTQVVRKKPEKVVRKKPEKEKVKEIEEKEIDKPMSELEKLEAELGAIESKLSSLK